MRTRSMMLVLIALALPAIAHAQYATFHIGFKGGVNFAEMSVTPDYEEVDHGRLTAFGGGAELGFAVSPSMAVLTDVLYLQKGASAHHKWQNGSEPSGSYREWDTDATLSYLVLAPTLRFSTPNPGMAPYVYGGAEISFLLDATATTEDDNGQSIDRDVKDNYTSTDFGVHFGAGFEIRARSYSFFVEGRYALGLTNIVSDDLLDDNPEAEEKHRGIYLFGGLRF